MLALAEITYSKFQVNEINTQVKPETSWRRETASYTGKILSLGGRKLYTSIVL
jgi:hypothetical protein